MNTSQYEIKQAIRNSKAEALRDSTDSYTYSNSAWTDAFGDAKYVSSSRSYSDELVGRVINRVAAKFGAEPKSVEDFRQGRAWNWRSEGGCDMGRELNVALSRHTCSLARKLFAEPVQGEESVIAPATGRTH